MIELMSDPEPESLTSMEINMDEMQEETMEFIDKHKQELTDGEYLKFCGFMMGVGSMMSQFTEIKANSNCFNEIREILNISSLYECDGSCHETCLHQIVINQVRRILYFVALEHVENSRR